MKKIGKLNRPQWIIFIVIILLLCIPFIEQLGGNESFNWTFFDYLMAFILLFSVGITLEFTVRSIRSRSLKRAAIVVIVLFFILLWAELAVGIFNSPIAGD
jgi:hypothetical protein